MYAKGDRIKHTAEFCESVASTCAEDATKMAWLHGNGTVVDKLSRRRLLVKWDCDTETSIVDVSNVWFADICGDSFYFDERQELLVGFCKRAKKHLGDCVPTELR